MRVTASSGNPCGCAVRTRSRSRRDTAGSLPISPPEGEMPQAEGECVAGSRRRRGPPPQSLRDSSPSGGAIGRQIPLTTLNGQRNPDLLSPRRAGGESRSEGSPQGVEYRSVITAGTGSGWSGRAWRRCGTGRRARNRPAAGESHAGRSCPRSRRRAPSTSRRDTAGSLPISPPEGEMPQAEGECVAVSRRRRGPPPQSLRDSSPAGDLRVSPTAPTFPVCGGVTK